MSWFYKKNPLFPVRSSVLEDAVHRPLAPWMLYRIEKDLSLFSRQQGGSIQSEYPIFKFSIRSNRLIAPTIWDSLKIPRLFKMVFFFKKLLRYLPLPDLDFLFTVEDIASVRPSTVFGISREDTLQKVALFPHVEWLSYWDYIKKKLNKLPWEKREPVLFWRGATTGSYCRKGCNPRLQAVQLSQAYPQEIDAFFSSFCQIDAQRREYFRSLLKDPVSAISQTKYKYLLSLDGNCFGGSFFWQLASGSVVFKHDSPYIEWYYDALEPFVHYIPFSADASDLLDKKRWAERHDAEAKAIMENALKFSDRFLSTEGLMAYVYHLLIRYAEI